MRALSLIKCLYSNNKQIDVESVERPLYYSSCDETDTDCLYFLPVAPEIDEPEGELTHGYDTGKPSDNEKSGGAGGGSGENTGGEKSTSEGPPAKKTKTKDIDINGEAYDENAILSGKSARQSSRKISIFTFSSQPSKNVFFFIIIVHLAMDLNDPVVYKLSWVFGWKGLVRV